MARSPMTLISRCTRFRLTGIPCRSSQAFICLEGGLQVLTVHLPHQGQVCFGSPLGTVVEAGTANAQQHALPHYRQLRMFPVHHLPTPARTHGPDLSAKKSRSTFSWPISWYNRAIRAAAFLPFCSLPLLKTPEAPSTRDFFQA